MADSSTKCVRGGLSWEWEPEVGAARLLSVWSLSWKAALRLFDLHWYTVTSYI